MSTLLALLVDVVHTWSASRWPEKQRPRVVATLPWQRQLG